MRIAWDVVVPHAFASLALMAFSILGRPMPCCAAIEHVVLIGIDGLRPDYIEPSKAPTLSALKSKGSWGADAKTVEPSKTLTAFASMLTGQTPQKHGLIGNDAPTLVRLMTGRHAPTILELVRRSGAGLTAGVFAGVEPRPSGLVDAAVWLAAKKALIGLLGGATVVVERAPDENASNAREVARRAVAQISVSLPSLTFIYMKDVDTMGHDYGWGSPQQQGAIRGVDEAVGDVLRSIEKAGLAGSTMVLIASDHGGGAGSNPLDAKNHDLDLPGNRRIVWFAFGAGIRPGLNLTGVKIYDTAPTLLYALNLPRPADMDGRPVTQMFAAPGSRPGAGLAPAGAKVHSALELPRWDGAAPVH